LFVNRKPSLERFSSGRQLERIFGKISVECFGRTDLERRSRERTVGPQKACASGIDVDPGRASCEEHQDRKKNDSHDGPSG
jgi:hypothetical protein